MCPNRPVRTTPPLVVKLKPGLADLFQFCQTWCTPDCCRWRAFDLTKYGLTRWCEFRESWEIDRAVEELEVLANAITDEDRGRPVEFDRWFRPSVGELADVLADIRPILERFRQGADESITFRRDADGSQGDGRTGNPSHGD